MSYTYLLKVPSLYNPILDSIFNCRHYLKLPLRRIFEALATDHTAYTILVPSAHLLREHADPSSGLLFDKCYQNEDFVSSHILRSLTLIPYPQNSSHSIVFSTLNGKQILIKNDTIFTGKGFKQSHRAQITSYNLFTSYCNYFPRGSKFMVIFVDDCLFVSRNVRRQSSTQLLPRTELKALSNSSQARSLGVSSPASSAPPSRRTSSSSVLAADVNESITFIKLLRDFPILSNAVSNQFYNLFHHNNKDYIILRHSTRKRLCDIHDAFLRMVQEAYQYVLDSVKASKPEAEQTFTILRSILRQYPGLDINRLVFEFVELNMYDAMWAQITFQFNNNSSDDKAQVDLDARKVLTPEAYRRLACLLLNHLDVPINAPWHLNNLTDRIRSAIKVLARLDDHSIVSSQEKIRIITQTISVLTANTDILVDADTLMGLLIMTVVHARVKDFDAHLYYIKNYSLVDYTQNGALSYTLSNLEAVLCHLSSSQDQQLQELVEASNAARDFWDAIDAGSEDVVQKMVSKIATSYGVSVPNHHFLYLRDIDGQDCIMRAVRSGSFAVYSSVLHSHPEWFSIDDILFSRLSSTRQTLVMVALQEGRIDIARDLVTLIMSSCTLEEQVAYFAVIDTAGRHVGHYLFHDAGLIPVLGQIIDWNTMDAKSRTPLMCVCRCYDHPHYAQLVALSFACVSKRYGGQGAMRWLDRHVDRHGNTLLHIVAHSLEHTGLLTSLDTVLDVNAYNTKSSSPLATYIKFGRLDNVQRLLKDPRLHLMSEDPKNGFTIFDLAERVSGRAGLVQGTGLAEIDSALFAHYQQAYLPCSTLSPAVAVGAVYSDNKNNGKGVGSWQIQFRRGQDIVYRSLDNIKQTIHLSKLEYPFSLLPDPDQFWLNYGLGQDLCPFFYRFRVNRLLESLLVMLVAVAMQSVVPIEPYMDGFASEPANTHNSDSPLMLERVRNVTRGHEREKRRVIQECNITALVMEEIEYFLAFWKNNLQSYLEATHRLFVFSVVCEYKLADVTMVLHRLLNIFFSGLEDGDRDKRVPLRQDLIERYTQGYFSTYVLEIEHMVAALLRHTSRLLNKLDQWKEVYGAIESLNTEVRAIHEPAEANGATGASAATSTDMNHSIIPLDDPLIKLDSVPKQPDTGDDESVAHFFSFGLVETKIARMQRTLQTRADFLRRLNRLGGDIKYEHEQLALAFSSHMQQRTQLFAYGIRMHVLNSIRRMRQGHTELLRIQLILMK